MHQTLKVISGVTLIAYACLASALRADDGDGNYAIRGFGALECQAFSEAASEGQQKVEGYVRWLEGYFTGMNFHLEETYDVSPFVATSDVAVLILNQCTQEPDSTIENVAKRMTEALYASRETERSETSTIEFEGNSVTIRRNTLRRIQDHLFEYGYYNGESDGLYGPGTRSALIEYQATQELTESGIPDRATVLRIISSK